LAASEASAWISASIVAADHHGRQAGRCLRCVEVSSDRPPFLAASVWQTVQYFCTSAFCCATGVPAPNVATTPIVKQADVVSAS
jgi:hypothetical protein